MKIAGCIVLISISIGGFAGQASPQPKKSSPDEAVGTWKGASRCLVKPSPCHDEIVVYHIQAASGDSLVMQANKIVDGKEEDMGSLNCRLAEHTLSCEFARGVWRYQIAGPAMNGTLVLADGTVFRKVSARRVQK